MAHGSFGTAINCMDGRMQIPVLNWIKSNFGVDYVDKITEPGPDKVLAEGTPEQIESIKKRVEISVNGHGSRVIVVTAHGDCAGNPVDKETHLEHLRTAMQVIAGWAYPVTIIGLWVDSTDWKPEVIEILEQP